MRKKRTMSAVERMGLPAEIMPRTARVTISGVSQVIVENHAGLSLLSAERVEVGSGSGILRITGQGLELGYMTKNKIILRGFIVAAELI